MCRNYIVEAMNESIEEIVRVLRITSSRDEAGALASSTGTTEQTTAQLGGLLPGTLAAKVYQAKELVAKTGNYLPTGLESALLGRFVIKCLNPDTVPTYLL